MNSFEETLKANIAEALEDAADEAIIEELEADGVLVACTKCGVNAAVFGDTCGLCD